MNGGKHHCCCGHSLEDTHSECCDICCSSEGVATEIDEHELAILRELLKCNRLPVSQFEMCSSQTDEARFTALAPVYIDEKSDSMEKVKLTATRLKTLEAKKLISLDFEEAIPEYDYEKHLDSDLFHYFERTVQEGRRNARFLCETAEIECGSIAITPLGVTTAEFILGNAL